MRRPLALLSFALLASIGLADRPITITFLHSNDLHAHIEPTLIRKVSYGGYARQATLIKQFRAKEKNVILLNAGDTFQGTFYFNVYEGLADLAILNALGYDAGTFGNHEFDHGPKTLAAYVKLATFPIVSANIDASGDPDLGPLVKPYTILTVGGERVGIVGATTPDASNISMPGPTIKFSEPFAPVQRAVDDLTKQGVNKIVLVTHIGYEEDQKLVARLHNVDLVVGGHSHSPLGTPTIDGWRNSEGPYPTLTKDADGVIVPIVQCYEWGKVFGEIKLSFDGNGHLLKVIEAKPIVVDKTIPEDPAIVSMIAAYMKPIAAQANAQVGSTVNAIPKEANAQGESLMANLIADSLLSAGQKGGAVAAFVNEGGVRASLEAGKITYGNAISVQPFGNTVVLLEVTGTELKAALEHGTETGMLLPSHGTSYKITGSQPLGSRVSDVIIAGQPLDLSKTYRLAFHNFVSNGGDGHAVLKAAKGYRLDTGTLDIDALVDYLKAHSPLDLQPEGRVMREK